MLLHRQSAAKLREESERQTKAAQGRRALVKLRRLLTVGGDDSGAEAAASEEAGQEAEKGLEEGELDADALLLAAAPMPDLERLRAEASAAALSHRASLSLAGEGGREGRSSSAEALVAATTRPERPLLHNQSGSGLEAAAAAARARWDRRGDELDRHGVTETGSREPKRDGKDGDGGVDKERRNSSKWEKERRHHRSPSHRGEGEKSDRHRRRRMGRSRSRSGARDRKKDKSSKKRKRARDTSCSSRSRSRSRGEGGKKNEPVPISVVVVGEKEQIVAAAGTAPSAQQQPQPADLRTRVRQMLLGLK